MDNLDRSIEKTLAAGKAVEVGGKDTEELSRLAALSPIEYDRERGAAAESLGIRVTTLDGEIARLRGDAVTVQEGSGHALRMEDPEPWPEKVNGADLLTDIKETLGKFIVMPEGGPEAVTLWIIHTYCHEAAFTSPILGITSPERRCGKSTLQSLLTALVRRPLPASNISPAAVFRSIEKWTPTLLIDEADTFLKDNEELRGIINSGHTRPTAFVVRVEGEDNEPRTFSTWAPKAIALIGRLPATLHDRAIGVPMRRKLPGERVEKLREDRLNLDDLRRKCQRWALDHIDALRGHDPVMPGGLNDRAADNWRPLLAIADLAGGDWPKLARTAVKLLARGDDDHEEARVKLLADIRDIFKERNVERITSADLVALLVAMEDRPWPEWKNGKPLTVNQLAGQLRPFNIKPGNIRQEAKVPKGYHWESFEDAFNRYLPPFQTATPLQTSSVAACSQIRSATQKSSVAVQKTLEAAPRLRCSGVAVQNTPDRQGNAYQQAKDGESEKGKVVAL